MGKATESTVREALTWTGIQRHCGSRLLPSPLSRHSPLPCHSGATAASSS